MILGSGVFVPGRASDGGGFLERHAADLRTRRVWLFCTGPIGGRAGRGGSDAAADECAVVTVGRAIGAAGVAMFGTIGMPGGADPVAAIYPADAREVRAWALSIAADLGVAPLSAPTTEQRSRGLAAARLSLHPGDPAPARQEDVMTPYRWVVHSDLRRWWTL